MHLKILKVINRVRQNSERGVLEFTAVSWQYHLVRSIVMCRMTHLLRVIIYEKKNNQYDS